MQSLRIAVLGLRGIPGVMGGVESHCESLYPKLASKGHQITLFARKGYVDTNPFDFNNVRVRPIWTIKNRSIEAILHTAIGILIVAKNRSRYDILHIHAIGPALLIPIARLFGIKVVMTHHGHDYERKKWGYFAKKVLRAGEKIGCFYANAIICVSKNICSSLETACNHKNVWIPNGVLPSELVPPGEFLSGFNLRQKKYILTVARLVPEKGLHDLFEAFGKIKCDWQLVVAGSTDHEDSYSKNLRKIANKDRRIVMVGFVGGRNLAELYSSAGIFILPSYHEGLPIACLEAMSYGLPLLVSDIPANIELVDSSNTFQVGNIDDLSEKISERIRNYKPEVDLKNIERIELEFNWERIASLTEKIYFKVLNQKNES